MLIEDAATALDFDLTCTARLMIYDEELAQSAARDVISMLISGGSSGGGSGSPPPQGGNVVQFTPHTRYL